MRLNSTHAGAAKAVWLGLFAVVLFCASLIGCDDFCLVVVSNPGGSGGVGGVGTTCPVTPTGNVSLGFGSSLASTSVSASVRAPHIFVTLRGIEALPSSVTAEDAPNWQELAPQLAAQPVQIDLSARTSDSCGPGPLGGTAVPAGAYSQIRLSIVPNLTPNQPATSEATVQGNGCGRVALSCFVTPDAAVWPLVWDNPPELHVPSENIAGGYFRILPGRDVHLIIEFEARSTAALIAGDALRLVPTFFVSEQSPCGTEKSPGP